MSIGEKAIANHGEVSQGICAQLLESLMFPNYSSRNVVHKSILCMDFGHFSFRWYSNYKRDEAGRPIDGTKERCKIVCCDLFKFLVVKTGLHVFVVLAASSI